MSAKVNLIDLWAEDAAASDAGSLQAVRLDANETAVVPFTTDVARAALHYCNEPEVRGYVVCNGPGCVLCRAGRKPEERALLPVYLPAAQAVGVLAISPAARPGALRPQIMPVFRAGKRVALLLSKADLATFHVGTVELTDGMDDGAPVIKAFLERYEAGAVDLTSIYARLDNRDLAAIPGIATMLKLKGVPLDDLR